MTPFARPEELDVAILREMYRDRRVGLTGIDPRLNASRVARSLGIGRNRVAGRLRGWRTSGFLRRYAVWLHPGLLGWVGGFLNLRVGHPRGKPGLLEQLALVDGVLSAVVLLGGWVSVTVIAPDRPSLQRRWELLRRLTGVVEAEPLDVWNVPLARTSLTPLELRIVRALRAAPEATIHDIARAVGISTRTMTRKYSALLDDGSVWFVPLFDFSAFPFPVVMVSASFRPDGDPARWAGAVRARYPLAVGGSTSFLEPRSSTESALLYVLLPSPAQLEDLERTAEAVPGVDQIDLSVLVRVVDFPEWYDRHLAQLAGAGPVRGRAEARDPVRPADRSAPDANGTARPRSRRTGRAAPPHG